MTNFSFQFLGLKGEIESPWIKEEVAADTLELLLLIVLTSFCLPKRRNNANRIPKSIPLFENHSSIDTLR